MTRVSPTGASLAFHSSRALSSSSSSSPSSTGLHCSSSCVTKRDSSRRATGGGRCEGRTIDGRRDGIGVGCAADCGACCGAGRGACCGAGAGVRDWARLVVASSCCLGAFALARDFDFWPAALRSPTVIRTNSHFISSPSYLSCIGWEGDEYEAETSPLRLTACCTIALKSLTLMTMWRFSSSTSKLSNSSRSMAIEVWRGFLSTSWREQSVSVYGGYRA